MMVQNGYAYIAEKCIFQEAPNSDLELIYIPTFVVTYPLQLPDGQSSNEYYDSLKSQIRSKLEDTIVKCGYFPEEMHLLLDFDIDRSLDIDNYQPNLCWNCKGRLYKGGNDICEACVMTPPYGPSKDNLIDEDYLDEALQDYLNEKLKEERWNDHLEAVWWTGEGETHENMEAVWWTGEGETHENMDIDNGEDDCEELTERLGSTLDIGN